MKKYKVTYTDKEGKKVEEGLQSGLKLTFLVEPSQWYLDNVVAPSKVVTDRVRREIDEAVEYEKKIKDKLKEIAEKAIEEEEK